ncbi:putative aspartate aminotransferase, cytoplasmic [Tilletiaria anomala UBC 951]|uniref:Aspartate aminotransferase n=1 Tax=Tilletiaria anomala (strain ATCC 24038 / CBS 436.72 / UBC 951) TaxID=1037660 RepID=A0A066W0Y2_TILAU|nr:putative aspartate aminotransferase, cytoplasmic [Tilletiaria anomala UBC 951]KDN44729.1 putative aspartate aminotransferase, cytoplasmic [Tilletiaria anomala UBC 951]
MPSADVAHVWEAVPQAPADPIFQLTASFRADSFPQKVNLGVGAYRDDNGKPWVLPSIKAAKKVLLEDESIDHEYLSITGLNDFTLSAAKLILGKDSKAILEGRVSSVQTISGTGANHLGAVFLSKFYRFPAKKEIYLSNPTWANHKAIFNLAGINPTDYPYYNPQTIALDFEGFTGSLQSAPNGSAFLLHACAHNPTGVDPTKEQWSKIADIFGQKGHFAFFDCAYQGFASGDLDGDAWAVRHFVERRDIPVLVCQSFAKNAGLYGERIGALHVVSPTKEQNAAVFSQLSVIQRGEISNPPAFGARLVTMLLTDERLWKQWQEDVKTMSYRIIDMRKALYAALNDKLHTPPPKGAKDWSHILKQIGMFTFTGLNPAQCKKMVETHHIYMTGNGRISMAGISSKNVEYVAKSIDDVIRTL